MMYSSMWLREGRTAELCPDIVQILPRRQTNRLIVTERQTLQLSKSVECGIESNGNCAMFLPEST